MSAAKRNADDERLPESQRPTRRPPSRDRRESGFRVSLDDCADATIAAILEHFEAGNYLGALALADRLLDERRVPTVVAAKAELARAGLDDREELFVSLLDGETALEEVLENAGMPLIDALKVLCDLVERRIVALREVGK